MDQDKTTTLDRTIETALQRENELKQFYEQALRGAGYDAAGVFAELIVGSHVRIARLEELQVDLQNLRVIWGGMVD